LNVSGIPTLLKAGQLVDLFRMFYCATILILCVNLRFCRFSLVQQLISL
jgi:hypothetical protein